MSSSASTSSSPSSFTSPRELSNMILRDDSVEYLNHAFEDDVTGEAHLRHYKYISTNINRLECALDHHKQQQQELFDHMLANKYFRVTIRPVVRQYRQQQQRSGFDPHTGLPLVYRQKPYARLTKNSRSSPPPHSVSGAQDSPSSSPSQSNHSAESEPGSSQNPIDVDADTSRCVRCGEQGHTVPNCSKKLLLPTCERCGQFGHEQPDCDTKIRSFLHCHTCEWLGQRQSKYCDHYDMSPVDKRNLRGRIPYDDEA